MGVSDERALYWRDPSQGGGARSDFGGVQCGPKGQNRGWKMPKTDCPEPKELFGYILEDPSSLLLALQKPKLVSAEPPQQRPTPGEVVRASA